MATFTAFYDANVLYPAELRNLLMHLSLTGLFRAKWSADVHEEWISALLEKRPDLTRNKLERTRALAYSGRSGPPIPVRCGPPFRWEVNPPFRWEVGPLFRADRNGGFSHRFGGPVTGMVAHITGMDRRRRVGAAG